MSNLGFKLRQKRKELGLRLTQVAETLNISFSNLSELERGIKNNPQINLLKKLATFYKVPLEYFLSEDSENNLESQKFGSASYYEVSESLTSNRPETQISDITKQAGGFYNNVINYINNKKNLIEPELISGSIEGNKFCLLMNEKYIFLKIERVYNDVTKCISDFYGDILACIEILEGNLDNPSIIYLYCWHTPLCSKAQVFSKISGILDSNLIFKAHIYDMEIKKYYQDNH